VIEHDVVVIGAGAAGIAATRRLVEAGVDVSLVEACNRVGGRALSVRQDDGAAIDLGCGWLHSADVNPWTDIAAALGFEIDRTLPPWQDDKHDLGMSLAQRRAYRTASTRFWEKFDTDTAPTPDQPAADYLGPGNPWNSLINATSTYINGAELDRVSALDFARYADTHINWRVPAGYGTLIARCKVVRIDHSGAAIRIETGDGVLRARTVIVTVSTNVLAADAIRFTPDIPGTRDAAAHLPLGHAEKVFLTLDDAAEFPKDVRFFGATNRAATGAYQMRPFGRPMIEAYFGGSLARDLQAAGKAAIIAFACEEIAAVLGAAIIARLRPLGVSSWADDRLILRSYSHAEPGHANARSVLSTPIQTRIFFAGEACSIHDFSTAHGAYKTGVAAAEASLAQNKSTARLRTH
jgi:monoamine oxidase